MNTKEISKNIKLIAVKTTTLIFFFTFVASMLFVRSIIGMGEQVEFGIIFMLSLVGIGFTSTAIIGAIRVTLSEELGLTQIIGLMVAGVCTCVYIIFTGICMYTGDLLDALNISTLYLGNGFIVDMLYAYTCVVNTTSTLIFCVLCIYLVYYFTLLWDNVEEYQKKANDG